MIDKQDFGVWDVHCDKCSNYDTYEDCDSFEDLCQKMKEEGWKSVKVDGEWNNICPIH